MTQTNTAGTPAKESALMHIIFGLLAAFGVSLALILIAAVVLLVSLVPEGSVGGITLFISAVSSAVGGILTGRGAKTRVLLYGGLTGTIYAVAVHIIGLLTAQTAGFSGWAALSLLLCLLCGGIGGLVSGKKPARKRRR